MDAVDVVVRLGGVARASEILAGSSRRSLKAAVRRQELIRIGRGRYALASVARDHRDAARLGGVVSHLSAAQAHGWEVKVPSRQPWVTVQRNRRASTEDQAVNHIVFANYSESEIVGTMTNPVRTVIDCARRLPFDEALVVADSALRHRAVTIGALQAGAAQVKGKGAARARRVAALADGRAANPFESVLRALVIESGVLNVEPQVGISAGGREWHPDLVDTRRRVVLEADSWTFHATREAHSRDCVRYNALTLAGWLVLRFTWEQVMLSPAYVLAALACLPRGSSRRTNRKANAA